MRRVLVMVPCLVGLLSATTAGAQIREGEWLVGPRFGWSFPVGDASDLARGSWSAGATIDYAFAGQFSFGATVTTNRFREQSGFIQDAIGTDVYEADLRVPSMTFHFRGLQRFSGRLHGFGKIGVGFYAKNSSLRWTDPTDGPQAVDQSELSGGAVLGAGFWIPAFTDHFVEVEMAYHFLFDEDPAFNIQKARTTFWLLSASFLFSLGGS